MIAEELQEEITPVAAEVQTAQFDIYELKAALEHDSEFFIQFYMGELLTTSVPEIHTEVFGLMTGTQVDKFVCAIPRDHAKTTLAKLACIWYFIFHTPTRFIVYVSNTAGIAEAATKDIIAFIESPNSVAVFGVPEMLIRRDGEGYYEFIWCGKHCILKAQGAGAQVRGLLIDNKRPDLAIVDDLESLEGSHSIGTPESFKKLKKWFYGPFKKALNKFNNKIIMIGNLISVQSLLYQHIKSKFWFSRVYGCLRSDGTPLWPEAWPLEKLKQDFEEYQEAGETDVWFAEMMNMPLSGLTGLLKAEEIQFAPEMHPSDSAVGFITVDLAISEEETAHHTVATVHKWNTDFSCWQVVEYQGGHIDPIQLWRLVVRLAFKWRIRVIGIESEAYQASLQYVFPHFARLEGVQGLVFKPLFTRKKHKIVRLAAWAGTIKEGHYRLTEGDFMMVQQLLSYDKTKKKNEDDYIDSASYGPQMEQLYSDDIMVEYDGPVDITGETLDSYSVCDM